MSGHLMVCESIKKIKYVLVFEEKKNSSQQQQQNSKAMKIPRKRKMKEKNIIDQIKIQKNE